MSSEPTRMAQEIAEVEAVLERQQIDVWPMIDAIAAEVRLRDPSLLVTIARGSSDHAALYLGPLAARIGGIAVASLPPSLASVYHRPLRLSGAVAITVSQSGASPDILSMVTSAREAGAFSLALLNEPASPIGKSVDHVIPLCAHPERAVAATKSVLASMVAGARLIARWFNDNALLSALDNSPQLVSTEQASSAIAEQLANLSSCFVLGRGSTLPIAMEAALKLKETCAIHAEAFSSAEVLHGPAALVGPNFPVLAFVPQDEARAGMLETIKQLRAFGADILIFDQAGQQQTLHPLLAPLPMLHGFYRNVEAAARLRGRDPDNPPHLKKVTITL